MHRWALLGPKVSCSLLSAMGSRYASGPRVRLLYFLRASLQVSMILDKGAHARSGCSFMVRFRMSSI